VREIDSEKGTAEYIDKPPKTLAQWRYLGKGPRYIRCGNTIRYRKTDVDAWLDENTVEPKRSA
jgi:hypothetical protein